MSTVGLWRTSEDPAGTSGAAGSKAVISAPQLTASTGLPEASLRIMLSDVLPSPLPSELPSAMT